MEDEVERERTVKRKRIAERRKLEREKDVQDVKKTERMELFLKLGIISIVALIPVDFIVTMYPILFGTIMTLEVAAFTFFLMQGLGVLFGLGTIYAGKRVSRDSGMYGGVFQLDGAIIAILNLAVFLIVSPLRYTQQDLIVNSLYYGLNTISSITVLIFTILIAIFLLIVGTNSQKKNLKYLLALTGILWLANLFVPAFRPSLYQDVTLYTAFSAFTWVLYGLTAYGFWKILYDFEGVTPLKPEAFKLK